MIEIAVSNTIESPWIEMEPVRLGDVPVTLPTPDAFVCVTQEAEPWKRFDLYGAGDSAFMAGVVWHALIAVGFGYQVHFIDPSTDAVVSADLGSYFGHLYPHEDRLLVASGDRLLSFDATGGRLWESECVGID